MKPYFYSFTINNIDDTLTYKQAHSCCLCIPFTPQFVNIYFLLKMFLFNRIRFTKHLERTNLLCRYLGGNFGVVLPPQTTVTSNRPFSLMIAIAPPVCPSEATSADAPTTAAPTRIFAELLLLSRRTLAFLLKDSRWLVTLTSRCQACTVPIRKGKSY